jgi:hypothetical protein
VSPALSAEAKLLTSGLGSLWAAAQSENKARTGRGQGETERRKGSAGDKGEGMFVVSLDQKKQKKKKKKGQDESKEGGWEGRQLVATGRQTSGTMEK